MNNSTKPGNNPQLIVNALLTFIISLLHSAASDIRLVEIICKLYDNDEIKMSNVFFVMSVIWNMKTGKIPLSELKKLIMPFTLLKF